jgi:hypothetical protein
MYPRMPYEPVIDPSGTADLDRIQHDGNPSGRTMALGSTQPLTEMSTMNVSWG